MDDTNINNTSDNTNLLDNALKISAGPRNKYDIALFLLFSIPMILITILYNIGTIKNVPCNNDLLSNISRNFIHLDISHIVGNLSVFYILSIALVKTFGFGYVVLLILALLVIIVIFETIYLKMTNNSSCSIGFSGILYGLLAWNILSQSSITASSIISIAILVIQPSLSSANVSLSGHIIGAVAGVLTYFVAGNKIKI